MDVKVPKKRRNLWSRENSTRQVHGEPFNPKETKRKERSHRHITREETKVMPTPKVPS